MTTTEHIVSVLQSFATVCNSISIVLIVRRMSRGN